MTSNTFRAAVPWAAALLLGAAACGGDRPEGASGHTSLVAAGDISSCWWRGDEATARLLDDIPGVVAPLGDVVYQRGTASEFSDCYHPTWGRHRERSRPAIGNHEWRTERGAPYFAYFGERAGPAGKGWYSYELDGWHVIVLNSMLPVVDGSEQMAWLRDDLRAHPTRCTLAYFHHPRFSSGDHGGSSKMDAAWRVMEAAGVEVILSGHDHHYERFAPQTGDARRDDRRGIRQFVVGTGGAPSYRVPEERQPNSEVFANDVRGVLRMDLRADAYAWEFVPIVGRTFRDSGRTACH